jgi:hypothetical protein
VVIQEGQGQWLTQPAHVPPPPTSWSPRTPSYHVVGGSLGVLRAHLSGCLLLLLIIWQAGRGISSSLYRSQAGYEGHRKFVGVTCVLAQDHTTLSRAPHICSSRWCRSGGAIAAQIQHQDHSIPSWATPPPSPSTFLLSPETGWSPSPHPHPRGRLYLVTSRNSCFGSKDAQAGSSGLCPNASSLGLLPRIPQAGTTSQCLALVFIMKALGQCPNRGWQLWPQLCTRHCLTPHKPYLLPWIRVQSPPNSGLKLLTSLV